MGGKTVAAIAAGALALGGVGVAAVATEDSATSPDATVQAQAAPPHPATESTGQYSATFHWGGVTEPGQTGYYVYQNGTQVADVTTPSYTFTGLDCGTTFTFGVAGHDGSGHTTPTSTTTYSTPACAGGGGGPTVNYYVAQSSAGATNGSSCANAAAVTTLSTSTHWTAGNVIGLCGTITSPITAQGSGTSGNPITLYWTSGATLSAPTWTSPSVSIDGRSYITLDGGANGSIQATAQGSGLAHQGTASIGVYAVNCSNCTIQNLLIANLYQHTSPSDTSVDQTQDNAIKFSGSNFTIANNTMHDMGWAIYQPMNSTDANVRIYGNNIYNVDHGWAPVANNFTGGNIGPYFFYDNHVHDEANWDTTTNAYHHDGIHCYTSAGGGAAHYNGMYIYNNRFDGTTGTSLTADIFIEGGSGAGATPCGDSTSSIWIFNNVASVTSDVNNGVFGIFSGNPTVLNNTLVGADTTAGLGYSTNSAAANQKFQNNVVTTANQVINTSPSYFAAGQPDDNVYANGGTNAFVCSSNFYNTTQFSNWQSCMGADSHSSYQASAALNTDGTPQGGSPTLSAGANLTSLCTGSITPLCATYAGPPVGGGAGSATTGNARPGTGAWNTGAF